jgi:methylenetetrahydrofolate dehydrogenase (NADP+)/methenyltetrahydrofolate cyclohydrolase
METRIVDGKALAKKIRGQVKDETLNLKERGITPGLAVILVGDDPASATYVRSKQRACKRAGMLSELYKMEASVTQEEIIAKVRELNERDDIDGILVQKPLPDHVNEYLVMNEIDPAKDVDGFHPVNVGKMTIGRETLVPATPLGILEILKEFGVDIVGKHAVVVGRSDIVGKPIALLLLHRHATVNICHSRTRNLAELCREADILVAAVGRTAMIDKDFVKPGATVIDVGINAVEDRDLVKDLFGDDEGRMADLDKKGYTLVGDVKPEVADIAGIFTPVPGGVGPLTIACLLKNCLTAAELRRG